MEMKPSSFIIFWSHDHLVSCLKRYWKVEMRVKVSLVLMAVVGIKLAPFLINHPLFDKFESNFNKHIKQNEISFSRSRK